LISHLLDGCLRSQRPPTGSLSLQIVLTLRLQLKGADQESLLECDPQTRLQ
jgi:hypothetical protein